MQISIHDHSFMERYQCLWQAHDANSFFRSPSHLRMIAELTHSELFFVVASQAGKPTAALPTAVLAGAYGPVINSLPYYGTYSALVGPDDAALAKMLQIGLLDHAYSIGASAVTVVDDWRKKSLQCLSNFDFVTERTNQFIDLTLLRGRDPIDAYHQKTRNLVRKAIKLNMTVRRIDSTTAINALAAAHCENMVSVNGIAKPQKFFDMLTSSCESPGDYRLYVASINGRDCGWLLNFYCGDTVEYYMPAVHLDDRALQPLSLLIHHAITEAVADGYAFWNFGGTWLAQETLRHFKIRWTATETTYSYYTWILNRDILKRTAKDVLASYPYFFVAPFELFAATEDIKRA
jgi:hypothetical protein